MSQVIGSWDTHLGVTISQSNIFERRKNLTGVEVINTVLPWPPVTIVEEDEDGTLYQTGEKYDKYGLNFLPLCQIFWSS